MRVIILVNGPAGSGKDTFGNMLAAELYKAGWQTKTMKFAAVLKSAVHALFGQDTRPDKFESQKNVKLGVFHGRTPRSLYQDMSEKFVKPYLGRKFFGEVIGRQILQTRQKDNAAFIITDSGFTEEVLGLNSIVPWDKFFIIRIHRPGYSFADEHPDPTMRRQAMTPFPCQMPSKHFFDIPNSGSIDQLEKHAKDFVQTHILEKDNGES